MGALAPVVTHWLPQDDLLLKNAVEVSAKNIRKLYAYSGSKVLFFPFFFGWDF